MQTRSLFWVTCALVGVPLIGVVIEYAFMQAISTMRRAPNVDAVANAGVFTISLLCAASGLYALLRVWTAGRVARVVGGAAYVIGVYVFLAFVYVVLAFHLGLVSMP
jgi:hypothetical protein